MSHTGRAVYRAMYEPENLTPAQREFTRGIEPVDDGWHSYSPTSKPEMETGGREMSSEPTTDAGTSADAETKAKMDW